MDKETEQALYSFEFIELYKFFKTATPEVRENVVNLLAYNINKTVSIFIKNSYADSFDSELINVTFAHCSDTAKVLRITCPDEKITPLARTIYICFSSDYKEFKYFTIEYDKNPKTREENYFIGENVFDGANFSHKSWGKLENEQDELKTILNLYFDVYEIFQKSIVIN